MLTDKQEKILGFIESYSEEKGYPPTIREIAKGNGLRSSSTVHAHLKRLERKGYIKRQSTMPRAIKVIKKQRELPEQSQCILG